MISVGQGRLFASVEPGLGPYQSIRFQTETLPEIGGADKLAKIGDFMDDLQNEVPLLASAINHFTVAALPQTSARVKNQNIQSGLRDLRDLSSPANGNQRTAYVVLLYRYGITTVFGMTVDAFLAARVLGLAGAVGVVGAKLANSVASISLITGQTGDLTLQTPIVIVLDGRR